MYVFALAGSAEQPAGVYDKSTEAEDFHHRQETHLHRPG